MLCIHLAYTFIILKTKYLYGCQLIKFENKCVPSIFVPKTLQQILPRKVFFLPNYRYNRFCQTRFTPKKSKVSFSLIKITREHEEKLESGKITMQIFVSDTRAEEAQDTSMLRSKVSGVPHFCLQGNHTFFVGRREGGS